MGFPTVGMDVRSLGVYPGRQFVVPRLTTIVRVAGSVRDSMHWRGGVAVSSLEAMTPGTVHVVTGGVVTPVAPAMAAREAEESHGRHSCGPEDQGEDVEVHLTTRWYGTESVRREESPAQKKADPSLEFQLVSWSVVSGYQFLCDTENH
jgi:hypothetical protein